TPPVPRRSRSSRPRSVSASPRPARTTVRRPTRRARAPPSETIRVTRGSTCRLAPARRSSAGARNPRGPDVTSLTRASMGASASTPSPALRAWQRLAVRLAVVFVVVTLATVAVVGVLVHQRQSREVKDTVGIQLLNIARVSALLVDPAAHAEAARAGRAGTPAYRRVIKALAAIREETLLTTPMRTLAGYGPVSRRAHIGV